MGNRASRGASRRSMQTKPSKRLRKALTARGYEASLPGGRDFLCDARVSSCEKKSLLAEVAPGEILDIYGLFMMKKDLSKINLLAAIVETLEELPVLTERESHAEAFVSCFSWKYYLDNRDTKYFPSGNAVYELVQKIISLSATQGQGEPAAAPEAGFASTNLVDWVSEAQQFVSCDRDEGKPMLDLMFARVTEEPALAVLRELSPRAKRVAP